MVTINMRHGIVDCQRSSRIRFSEVIKTKMTHFSSITTNGMLNLFPETEFKKISYFLHF